MQMFLENPLSPGDPAKEVVYSHFRRNLADMIECGLDSGAGVVVCSVASNLKDFPPLASLHGPAFEITRTNHWAELVNRGREHQAAGRIPEAQASYREAEAMDPLFALLQFQLGQCALALTNEADAARCFTAARDLDALPFRTDSRLNAIVREAAQRFASRGVVFVDSEAALQTAGTGGIPGDEWFFDHVHFRFDGNDRLARTLAEVIEPLLPAEITRGRSGAWASQVDCENRIGLTDWNRVRVLESVVRRLQEPPFTGQPNHAEQIRRLFEQLLAIRVELHPRRYLETEDVYTQALKREADDPRLRESFAEFLETSGQLERAESEWEQVCRLLPQHTIAWYQRGRVLGLLRRWEAAEQCLATALQLRPDFGEAQLELGQVYRQQNRPEAALAEYRAVQSRHPENARVLVMLADLLAAQGKREEAFDLLREAVRRQPTYWEARYLLGVEYAVKEQVAEAEREFQEVVRLRPDHVLARLNLGIAQVRLNRFAEARRQFEKVLEVDPENQRAKQHLASLSAMLAPAP
jgi:tetratricopeptide (TPR) repeat protein